jgi:hypothetical protein
MNHATTNGHTTKPKFPLGQVLATPGALVCADDKALNDESLIDGSRLLSAYRTSRNERLWIISEAADDEGHRCCTTILLPSEY